jgi:hypothetical protein
MNRIITQGCVRCGHVLILILAMFFSLAAAGPEGGSRF